MLVFPTNIRHLKYNRRLSHYDLDKLFEDSSQILRESLEHDEKYQRQPLLKLEDLHLQYDEFVDPSKVINICLSMMRHPGLKSLRLEYACWQEKQVQQDRIRGSRFAPTNLELLKCDVDAIGLDHVLGSFDNLKSLAISWRTGLLYGISGKSRIDMSAVGDVLRERGGQLETLALFESLDKRPTIDISGRIGSIPCLMGLKTLCIAYNFLAGQCDDGDGDCHEPHVSLARFLPKSLAELIVDLQGDQSVMFEEKEKVTDLLLSRELPRLRCVDFLAWRICVSEDTSVLEKEGRNLMHRGGNSSFVNRGRLKRYGTPTPGNTGVDTDVLRKAWDVKFAENGSKQELVSVPT